MSLDHITPRDQAEILAQALPYIRKFHGKTLVIKYGGNAMTDPALQQDFAEDVVLLKLVGHEPGGGARRRAADRRQRLATDWARRATFIQGMRVTDEEDDGCRRVGAGGQVQQDIVGLINGRRRQGRGLDRAGTAA